MNHKNDFEIDFINYIFSKLTGSREGADPDVVAPHCHVVNFVGISGIVRMEDESAWLSLN